MPNNPNEINKSKAISDQALRWFRGPVERYINEEGGIINAISLTTPFNYVVLAWSNASRDLVCNRLQAAIHTASKGDRKVFSDVVSFELGYSDRSPSGLILPS